MRKDVSSDADTHKQRASNTQTNNNSNKQQCRHTRDFDPHSQFVASRLRLRELLYVTCTHTAAHPTHRTMSKRKQHEETSNNGNNTSPRSPARTAKHQQTQRQRTHQTQQQQQGAPQHSSTKRGSAPLFAILHTHTQSTTINNNE